jgi:prepilin-type N-terminal cleavage/methylation domain-containing protein
MIRRFRSDTRGITLIELMVVLAILGLTVAMAGVYMSSGETELRSTLRNLRFDLEQAKREALSRNAIVYVDQMKTDEGYILCEDKDGIKGCANGDEEIKKQKILNPVISVHFVEPEQFEPISLSPIGSCDPATTIEMKSVVRNENCVDGCLETSYLMEINHVCRMHIGQKKETCVACSY